MATRLTEDDARRSLTDHAAAKGADIFEAYGPEIGWADVQRLLEDRRYVRFPCRVRFESEGLEPGEFGHAVPLGERPEEGFVIQIHPFFLSRLDRVSWLVLYQLVLVNYGDFASTEDAEAFGAAALGLTVDEYYQGICDLADQIE